MVRELLVMLRMLKSPRHHVLEIGRVHFISYAVQHLKKRAAPRFCHQAFSFLLGNDVCHL